MEAKPTHQITGQLEKIQFVPGDTECFSVFIAGAWYPWVGFIATTPEDGDAVGVFVNGRLMKPQDAAIALWLQGMRKVDAVLTFETNSYRGLIKADFTGVP